MQGGHAAPSGRRGQWVPWVLAAVGVFVATLVVAPTPARAHTPHDNIGDVAVSPDFEQSGVVYAIARQYVLKSDDRGDTWRRLVNGLEIRRAPSSVSVAPGDPDVVYVTSRGEGIFRSADAGATWTDVGQGLGHPSLLFAEVSPHSADVVVAAGAGPLGGAYLTTSGGREWTPIDGVTEARSAAFAPDDPGTILIGDESGQLHLTTDGGQGWTTVPVGDGAAGGVRAIAVSPRFSTDGTFHVATATGGVRTTRDRGATFSDGVAPLVGEAVAHLYMTGQDQETPRLWASNHQGAFVSDDGGRTWQDVTDGLTTDVMADEIGAPNFGTFSGVTSGPGEPVMFLSSFDGLFRLADRTEGWEYLDTQVPTNVVSLALSPRYADDSTVAVATYINGILVSTDGGRTWEPRNEGLATAFEWTRRPDYLTRLTGVGFHPTGDGEAMFTGQRGYYLESTDGGERWRPYLPEGILVEDEFPADYYIPAISPDFADDRTIVLGTDGGKVFHHTGDPAEITLVGNTGIEITALVLSSDFGRDQTVLAGTPEGMLKSTDGGRSWSASGEIGRPITSLSTSDDFANDGIAFAGTLSGLFTTDDAGETWTRVVEPAFGSRSIIEAAVTSPDFATDGTLLVSVAGRGLFRSTDGGDSFEAVGRELIENQVVLANFYHPTTEPIVFSPSFAEDRTVFGFAQDRVYRSTDAGDTWDTIEIPVTLHDPEVLPDTPLLTSARYGMETGAVRPGRGGGSDQGFDTPIGTLSAKRVAAATVVALAVFAVLSLPRPGAAPEAASRRVGARWLGGPSLVPNLAVRAAVAVAFLVAGLVVLAA